MSTIRHLCCSHGTGLCLSSNSLLLTVNAGLRLDAKSLASPVAQSLGETVVEVLLYSLDQLRQLVLVLVVDLREGNGGGGLLVYNLTKSALALDNGIWNSVLAAERWEPDDDLDRVDVVGNQHQRSLLGLNQLGNVVDTVLDDVSLLDLDWSAGNLGSGGSLQASGLGDLVLRRVLLGQLECLGSYSFHREQRALVR
jgi:hypothetical protein